MTEYRVRFPPVRPSPERRIYPVPLKPPSDIMVWDDWPGDVVDTLRKWNKGAGHRLSFVNTGSIFKCEHCEAFCEPQEYGTCRLDGGFYCDECMIAMVRDQQGANRLAYVGNARKHPLYGSCICYTPDRVRAAREAGLRDDVVAIDPECGYHKVAAMFPNDHSIPWNCPTYWDGCNCAGVTSEA